MATSVQSITPPTDAELLQAQADLWRHSLYYLTSMAFKCAVELEIPNAIHKLGGAATLPDLLAALSLPQNKLPYLRRLMRLLVTSGIFASNGDAEPVTYRLTPLSWLLVENVDHEDHTNQKYMVLGVCCRHYVDAALTLADWFKKDLAAPVPSPFEELHGVPLLDEKTPLLDPELDAMVNKGVAAHDNLAIGPIIRECQGLFKGVKSLTDCGGGDGTAARAIVKAYPHIKCTVLDLPRVIEKIKPDGVINYVAGDMLKSVPPAQAVMLKVVLHFFTDEDCVKILQQCKKAIPSRQEGGKVIVIDVVISPSLGPVMLEAQLLMDMLFLVNTRGRQRDENDWHEVFTKAGFSDYKLIKKFGVRGVFEVYP